MPPTICRRKSLVVTAEQSSTGNWLVDEGGQQTIYTKEAFEALFDTLEMQAEITVGPNTDMFGFDYSWCEGLEGRSLINELLGIECISVDNSIDGSSWMFKPYPLSTFGRMLNAVVKDLEWTWGDRLYPEDAPVFTEVGCGVGAKLVLAQKMFGLHVNGFDYNQDYCNASAQLLQGKECKYWTVQRLDARSRDAVEMYRSADVLYLNRPFVHLEPEGELENIAMEAMHHGAYIILANYASNVDVLVNRGWHKIDEDKVAVVLRKP
jgi:hypothetical protein